MRTIPPNRLQPASHVGSSTILLDGPLRPSYQELTWNLSRTVRAVLAMKLIAPYPLALDSEEFTVG